MFQGERVGGDVFGVQVENPFDGGLPGLERLFGQAIDQVEVQVIKSCLACGGNRFDHIKEVVRPFEHVEFFRVCGLDSVADAVDSDSS